MSKGNLYGHDNNHAKVNTKKASESDSISVVKISLQVIMYKEADGGMEDECTKKFQYYPILCYVRDIIQLVVTIQHTLLGLNNLGCLLESVTVPA
jgi:hypothetical protein